MNNSIFDLLESQESSNTPLDKKEEFMKLAENAPMPTDNSWFKRIQDYPKTLLKGTIEGVAKLGKVMSPLQSHEGKTSEQEQGELSQQLDKFLPTEDNFINNAARKGLKEAPTIGALPGAGVFQALPRAMLAGFFGQGAKDLGLPEWAQTAAEFTALAGPDVTRKLLSKGSNKDLIKFAKENGLTDRQITPLIQPGFKEKWLTKISPKRGSTERALKHTKSGLDKIYEKIQNSPAAKKEVSEVQNGQFINNIRKNLDKIPRAIRDKIEPDLNDLLENKITGENLINFYKDLNAHGGSEAKQLSILKEPVKKAISSLNPKLAHDFELTNKLYTKYYPIASKLKPNLYSDIISAGEYLGIVGALGFGHYAPLVGLLGEKAGKKLAQQLLIEPRFQQIGHKFVSALNDNKAPLAFKAVQDFKSLVKQFSGKTSKELEKISLEDIEKLLERNSNPDQES